jgi:two-component system cell cycle sensor histidine kinase/response regulator CckA
VLVVDDESAILELVSRVLERQSLEVVLASSPSDAIRVSAEHPGEIHLLLSDFLMQGMSGADLARRLEKLRPRMRVILMSGYADGAILPVSRNWQFIQKPFVLSALVEKVNGALTRK